MNIWHRINEIQAAHKGAPFGGTPTTHYNATKQIPPSQSSAISKDNVCCHLIEGGRPQNCPYSYPHSTLESLTKHCHTQRPCQRSLLLSCHMWDERWKEPSFKMTLQPRSTPQNSGKSPNNCQTAPRIVIECPSAFHSTSDASDTSNRSIRTALLFSPLQHHHVTSSGI